MRGSWVVLLGGLLAAGCGGGSADETPVAGTVTLDDNPLAGAAVTFRPTGATKGNGGTALTGPDGKYALTGPQGQKGIAPGTYKVTVSRRLRKDGTPPPPDVPPMESDAIESLPPRYSDPERTELTATVDGNKPHDFTLKGGKK
jgi:hypothetical protein